MTTSITRLALAVLGGLLAGASALAQVKEPPRAEKLDIQIRFRIRADRDERIRQYRALEQHLQSLGFDDARKNDPDRDLDILDPTAERHIGTIPSDKVMDVLKDVRVQNILFAPAGFTTPEPDQLVAVKLGLRTGLPALYQQQLHRQVVHHLQMLDFHEALGYDTQQHTLIRGYLPAQYLERLLNDLRYEPSGWFLPAIPVEKLPAPLRDRNPIQWAEIVPNLQRPERYNPPPLVPIQLKYSPDLRAMMLDPNSQNRPLRVEVVWDENITDREALRGVVLGQYAGASLDGVIGNVASIRVPRLAFVERLAQEPRVLHVRLPRQAAETIHIEPDGHGASVAEILKSTGVGELHKLGYKGAGVKVVVLGSDFTGAEKLIGQELPARTKMIDLTFDLTPELTPAPADPLRLGQGTVAARALAALAPECELVLVRIDPGSFFLLQTVVRLARGEMTYTDALQLRLAELTLQAETLERDKTEAILAYRAALADISDTQPAIEQRKKTRAALEAILKKEEEVAALIRRFNAYQREIATALAGAQVFVNTLVWESGYPLDALHDMANTLDRLAFPQQPRIVKRAGDPAAFPPPPLVWIQAASPAADRVWGGPFRDVNQDGLMEFAPPGAQWPEGQWSPQMNFLGVRTPTGQVQTELRKDTKLRFIVQWREAANPNFPESDIPYYPLQLAVWRQIDPRGETRSSDEMAEVARSVGSPNIVYRTARYLVFEQMLEWTVPADGRYALVVASPIPAEPPLPALRRDLEIHPRIVVETLNTKPQEPRVVFRSFTTPAAGVGLPGDALGATTVGIRDQNALTGGGPGLTLRVKPDILAPARAVIGPDVVHGPGVATAFAGGTAALLVQARFRGPNVFKSAGIGEGQALVIPERWYRPVTPPPQRQP
ncbi:MAG: hypothetical protein RMJ56_00590 [Gemmataceae bacterium]|nr:hypothetical protein [Gemmata sp.]MDW8196077.1 hypothetical protein [Gemmataceae bacterium]